MTHYLFISLSAVSLTGYGMSLSIFFDAVHVGCLKGLKLACNFPDYRVFERGDGDRAPIGVNRSASLGLHLAVHGCKDDLKVFRNLISEGLYGRILEAGRIRPNPTQDEVVLFCRKRTHRGLNDANRDLPYARLLSKSNQHEFSLIIDQLHRPRKNSQPGFNSYGLSLGLDGVPVIGGLR